jgi:hypothetical protein
MQIVAVAVALLSVLAHRALADLDTDAELPGLDIKARYCNAGSVGCECMTPENAEHASALWISARMRRGRSRWQRAMPNEKVNRHLYPL